MHWTLFAFAAMSLAASNRPTAQDCDPENYATRPKREKELIDKAFVAEAEMSEMKIVFRAPPSVVRQKLAAAMLTCSIPVSQSSDDVISAEYGEQTGMLGLYSITTHAYVTAIDDSITVVRLSGTRVTNRDC